MERMDFNPISPFDGPFNRQKKHRNVRQAKSVICEQTLRVWLLFEIGDFYVKCAL